MLLIFFIFFTIIFIIFLLSINLFLPKYSSDFEKLSPYECGMNPLGDARNKFRISYILVAVLFIIFDLEIIFLFPFTVILFENTLFSY
jgi:NADH-quinone oxidoreductase subunit A